MWYSMGLIEPRGMIYFNNVVIKVVYYKCD